MAEFTINDITGAKPRVTGTAWRISASSNDISGCEILVDAPGAGSHIYLESMSIIFSASIIVSAGSGESSSTVESVIAGPTPIEAHFDFSDNPFELPDNKALTAGASEAGLVLIVAKGFTI